MKQAIQLAYGRERLWLESWPENLLGILRAKEIKPQADELTLISRGLDNLWQYVAPKSKVLIIASDITRKVGTEKFLPVLVERLSGLGLRSEQMKVLFSTGLHRPQSQAEHRFLLGESHGKIEAVDHNCDQESVDYGVTSAGTRIRLSPLVDWADTIILTGGINFHYFAGFTGGSRQRIDFTQP
jgi:nickel-dependent lactate racemase